MRASKEQIIFVLVIFSLMGVCGGVTYFYLWEKLQVYAKDVKTKEHLVATLEEFEKAFHKTQPKALISAIQTQVQPWNEARSRWGAVFNMEGALDRFKPRPEEQFPKFWYDEESTRLLGELRMKILQTQPNLFFPQDVYTLFGVPRLEDWKTREEVTEVTARKALAKLSLGITVFEWLLEHRVIAINAINIWEPRKEQRFGDIVRLRTVGLSFRMGLKDLVNLIESFSALDRYITVDGISITWMYPWYEPQLEVELLVTQALWTPPDRRPAGHQGVVAAAAGAQPATRVPAVATALRNTPAQAPEEPGFFGNIWHWIKQNILVMH